MSLITPRRRRSGRSALIINWWHGGPASCLGRRVWVSAVVVWKTIHAESGKWSDEAHRRSPNKPAFHRSVKTRSCGRSSWSERSHANKARSCRAPGRPGMNDLSADGEACRRLMELDVQLWREEGSRDGRRESLLLLLSCVDNRPDSWRVCVCVCVCENKDNKSGSVFIIASSVFLINLKLLQWFNFLLFSDIFSTNFYLEIDYDSNY